ncbi:MAG: tryptophan--tRNA ligase, partial [Proteobacteria bacterium]|nr:tryptophan--tRNA ligase [Pseudomonadota bacterium]
GHPDKCPVYAYHAAYASDEAPQVKLDCEAAKLGCVAHKQRLADIICGVLAPHWERRAELVADPAVVDAALEEGARRARQKTEETMELVWRAMKLR